jgi:hypothetical protein
MMMDGIVFGPNGNSVPAGGHDRHIWIRPSCVVAASDALSEMNERFTFVWQLGSMVMEYLQ